MVLYNFVQHMALMLALAEMEEIGIGRRDTSSNQVDLYIRRVEKKPVEETWNWQFHLAAWKGSQKFTCNGWRAEGARG